MSTEGTDQDQGFEPYFEMERRARSVARWLTVGCLTVAVGTAAAFVSYGTDAITTAEKAEKEAKQQYEGARATILSLQDTIKQMQTDDGGGQTEPPVGIGQDDSGTITMLRKDLQACRDEKESLQKKYDALFNNDTTELRQMLDECDKKLNASDAEKKTLVARLDQCEQGRLRGLERIDELAGLIRRTMALERVSATLKASDQKLYGQMLAIVGERNGGRTTPGLTTGGRTTGDKGR